MKLFIILAAVTLAQAAKLDRTYLPPNARASAGSAFLQTPRQYNGIQSQSHSASYSNNAYSMPNTYAQTGAYSGFESRPERAQAALERNAAILRQDNSNDGETYAYAYETENGIYAEENGVATNGVQAQGGYTYTGDDGKVYSVRYTADENGFRPQGDHLPTSPPIPEEILKSLEQNARDEAAGIFNDGSYNDAKNYGNSQQQYYNKADSIITNNAYLRKDASQSSSSVAGVQKAYLPPFAGNIQKIGARQPIFSATSQSGRSITGVQKTYMPFAGNNQRAGVRQPSFNDVSVVGVQKAYLPPFAGNNQRIGMRLPTVNIAQSSIAGAQKQYLPPFAQKTRPQQSTFNAKDGYRY